MTYERIYDNMNSKKTLRVILLLVLAIVVCSFLAIITHAILPVEVDNSRLDGILVRNLGFPIVAVFYFLILYTHCVITVSVFKEYFYNSGFKSGIYFGYVLALLYMVGMQEIMLSVSPFDTWGLEFVIYQLLMGLGDAIPVIILCSIAGKLVKNNPSKSSSLVTDEVVIILMFTIIIGTARTMFSQTNIINNYMDLYPIPVTLWNYGFGFIIGIIYLILRENYKEPEKWMIWGLVVNWIIFNSFIGLIKDGALLDALLRSILDGIVVVSVVWIIREVTRKRNLKAYST